MPDDLFGLTDPRDPTGRAAKPRLQLPSAPVTLERIDVSQNHTKRVLHYQPELFDEAREGDVLRYRSYKATHLSNGRWHFENPDGHFMAVDLGLYRSGAAMSFGRRVDQLYFARKAARYVAESPNLSPSVKIEPVTLSSPESDSSTKPNTHSDHA